MRILLLDANWNQTAYLVAELASAGATVTLAAPSPPYSRGLGRYCRQVESPAVESLEYPAFLDRLLATEHPDLILPTCEPLQQLLWDRAERERNLVVFPRVQPEQRILLADRQRLYEFADRLGVPIPRSTELPSEESLQAAITRFGLPFVLRGTQGMSGEQVRIVDNPAAAESAYRELTRTSPGTPFVQEFLDGPRCLVGGLFDHGKPLAWFAQTTIECCPAPTGPSVRIRSMRDTTLLSYAEALFKELAWDGLACAEFIRLPSGEYRFLEINPRPWAAIRVADECGVPLLQLFTRYLLGERIHPTTSFRDGVECTLFPAFITARIRAHNFPSLGDFKAYLQLIRAAPWTKPALLRQFLRNIVWTHDVVRRQQVSAHDQMSA